MEHRTQSVQLHDRLCSCSSLSEHCGSHSWFSPRFASSEDRSEIPVWFVDDEKKHRRKPVPVTREMVEEYKEKWREINARPIKRLAEAKARKKRRVSEKQEGGGEAQVCRSD